jgi:hypothetical protein
MITGENYRRNNTGEIKSRGNETPAFLYTNRKRSFAAEASQNDFPLKQPNCFFLSGDSFSFLTVIIIHTIIFFNYFALFDLI